MFFAGNHDPCLLMAMTNADNAVSFLRSKPYKSTERKGMAAGKGNLATNAALTTDTASAITAVAASSTEERRRLQPSWQEFRFPLFQQL